MTDHAKDLAKQLRWAQQMCATWWGEKHPTKPFAETVSGSDMDGVLAAYDARPKTTGDLAKIVKELRDGANDPMWDAHCEMPKRVAKSAADALEAYGQLLATSAVKEGNVALEVERMGNRIRIKGVHGTTYVRQSDLKSLLRSLKQFSPVKQRPEKSDRSSEEAEAADAMQSFLYHEHENE